MKKILKEQTVSSSTPPTNKEKLLKYVEVGCIPNGKFLENTGLTTYPEAIYTKTAKGNTLYFFHDGKIGLVGQDNKVKLIPETFTCEEAMASFKTPKQKQSAIATQAQSQKTELRNQGEIQRLVEQGWSLQEPLKSMLPLYELLSVIDNESYTLIGKEMYRQKQTGNQQVTVDALTKITDSQIVNKKACKTLIDLYMDAADKNMKIDKHLLDSYANQIMNCNDQIKNWGLLSSVPEDIKQISSYGGARQRFAINFTTHKRLGEHLDVKNILKKNLLEVKSKKEDLMVESKIITNRFNFLVENRKFETDEDLKLFMEDYVAEVAYLRTQGYDSKVIEEAAGLFSTLSSIFGGTATALPSAMGEYLVDWLMKILNIPSGSYMAKVVSTFIASINVSDYDRVLTDCRFTTNALADALIKGYAKELQEKANMDKGASGFIVTALRNSVVDYFIEGNDSMVQKLEDQIADFLCPKMSKVSSKIADKYDELKTKVMA
jgi:hypothetical protein